MNRALMLITILVVTYPGMQGLPPPEGTFVHVRDFGALVDDGQDDAAGIKAAIGHAQAAGIEQVLSEAGTCEFMNIPGRESNRKGRGECDHSGPGGPPTQSRMKKGRRTDSCMQTRRMEVMPKNRNI
jgi:hypothetical protein